MEGILRMRDGIRLILSKELYVNETGCVVLIKLNTGGE